MPALSCSDKKQQDPRFVIYTPKYKELSAAKEFSQKTLII
jgi:hypothetical protein